MATNLIGRQRERDVLDRAMASTEAELVAIYGRRRVGKTYLIREVLGAEICFELTGAHSATLRTQLGNFAAALRHSLDPKCSIVPDDWRSAFEQLRAALRKRRAGARKRVVFLDELPWLAARRSEFLPAFEHFWNSWAVTQRDLVVVVCGSAAAWMVRELLQARGGLHNRVTRKIRLAPFTIAETEQYLLSRGIDLGRYQTLELYSALGGIPHYLRHLERGDSASTAIDRMCFARDGELHDEFNQLYSSLFEHSERHVGLIRALAKAPSGLTRSELVVASAVPSGGTISRTLDELEMSGFVLRMPQLTRAKRDAIYRLGDEYSLFFLKWIETHRGRADGIWINRRGTPAWRAWSGYAFEGMCLKHVAAIKRALGIDAVETIEAAWSHRPSSTGDHGAQIDLVIDRKDATINVCEMKFSENPFTIDKRYAGELRTKRDVFRRVTATRKAVVLTMITTYGVVPGAYTTELVDKALTMDALFER